MGLDSFEDVLSKSGLNNNVNDQDNKKKRPHQDEEVKRRADQSRAASLKYRRRKKERSDQLEKEYQVLKEEREKLLEMKNANEQLLRSVAEENEQLRAKTVRHKEIDEKKETLDIITTILNSQEQETHEQNEKLLEAIYRYREICTQLKVNALPRLNLSGSEPSEYLLATSTLFSCSCDRYALTVPEPSVRMNTMVQKLSQTVESLTPEQQNAITMTAYERQVEIEELRKERSKHSNKLALVFKDGCKSTNHIISQKPSLQILLSIATEVRSIQKLAEKEIVLWEKALDALLSHLTPRQQATFLIQQEFEYNCMDYLKTIWSSLNGSAAKPEVPLPPIAFTSLGSLLSPPSASSSESTTPSPSPSSHKRTNEDEFKFEL